MEVVLIGSGNVATVLGRLIIRNGHTVKQVISRNTDHAKALAGEFVAGFTDFNGVYLTVSWVLNSARCFGARSGSRAD